MLGTCLTVAGIIVGAIAAYFSRIAAINSQKDRLIRESGAPIIADLRAHKREKFVAVFFKIRPGDYTVTITSIRIPGHRIAPAYKENDIPSSSQWHLWDCPPENSFTSALSNPIRLTPSSIPP